MYDHQQTDGQKTDATQETRNGYYAAATDCSTWVLGRRRLERDDVGGATPTAVKTFSFKCELNNYS